MAHKITLKYGEPGKSETFNNLQYKVVTKGLYEGGLLSKISDILVRVSPFTAFIQDATNELGVRIEIDSDEDIAISSATPYIVIRLNWTNSVSNDFQIFATSYASIQPEDIIIGNGFFNGATLDTNFNYSRRTVTQEKDDLKLATNTLENNEVYVFPGNLVIGNNDISFAGGTITLSSVVNERYDLIYINNTGTLQVLEGEDRVGASLPFIEPGEIYEVGHVYRTTSSVILYDDITTYHNKKAVVKVIPKNYQNDIINGALDIWQRGTSFVGVASGSFSADRIKTEYISTSVNDVTQEIDVPHNNVNYSMKHNTTTAQPSIAAGDIYNFFYPMEGYELKKYVGNYLTLGFWVKSSTTGIFCVSFSNQGSDSSYIVEYTVNVADTWKYKAITIQVDTGLGTWDTTNLRGLAIRWVRAAGTNFQNTADTWHSGLYVATSNQVNNLANINDYLQIADITCNPGQYVTAKSLSFVQENLRCQRYYEVKEDFWIGDTVTGFFYGKKMSFMTEKRTIPTVTYSSLGELNFGATRTVQNISVDGVSILGSATATGNQSQYNTKVFIDAEL